MKENRMSNDYIPFRRIRAIGLIQRLIETIYQTLKDTTVLYEIFRSRASLEGKSCHKIGKDYIKERLEYINNVLQQMKGVNLQDALTVDHLREFLKFDPIPR